MEDKVTEKKPRQLRSINTRLTADNQTMHVRAFKTKTAWRSEVIITTGKGKAAKRERGLTAEHADEASARAAVDKHTDEAAKLGWQRKAARAIAVRQPDAFTSLPKPGKGKGK